MTIEDLLDSTIDVFYDAIKIYANGNSNVPIMTFSDDCDIPTKIAKLEFHSWGIQTAPVMDDGIEIDNYIYIIIYLDNEY